MLMSVLFVTRRFYSVLFRKLLDPDLAQSTKLALLLNMVFQALKRDDSLERQRAFVKRILQVPFFSASPFHTAMYSVCTRRRNGLCFLWGGGARVPAVFIHLVIT